MFDLLIRNATIIDGNGKPGFQGNVAIEGDKIVAVGKTDGATAKTTLDAEGLVVAPGFIDVHNHSDGWLLADWHLTPKTLQGFTTEVLMADGISYAPVNADTAAHWMYYLRALNGLRMDHYGGWESLDDYMQLLDHGNVQNSMMHIPYANVRSLVAGFGRAPIDDFQMRQMQREMQIGMDQGAVGVSTGLDYIVQCFSSTDEIIEACAPLKKDRGLYVTHVRYKKGLLPALEEAMEIGRRAEIPVHISHLKAQSEQQTTELLEYLEKARREVDLSFDVYPYQPGSTMLSYLLPYDSWEMGPLAASQRLHDPVLRRRFAEGLKAYRLDLDHIRLAWVAGKENTCHQGKTLQRYVDEKGVPVEEALLDLLWEERFAVLCVMDEGDDRLVHPMLKHDLYMMGTDGIYQQDGEVHPRMYGSTGRLLGRAVREWKLFSLEEAVERMTIRPAKRFQILRRGQVAVGFYADLVLFDPEQVDDPADFQHPRQPTVGIRHVLVNGVPIVEQGQPVAREQLTTLPGRFLRRGQ